MQIEHVAFQVEHPADVANWYVKNLGFTVKRGQDMPIPVRFLADASGTVMLELYNNPAVSPPDYRAMDPLLVHVAFVCPTVPETTERLVAAGAQLVTGPERLPNGDELAMLRDPWGFAVQLAKRAEPMI